MLEGVRQDAQECLLSIWVSFYMRILIWIAFVGSPVNLGCPLCPRRQVERRTHTHALARVRLSS